MDSRDSRKTLADKCFKAPDGRITLAQRPNLPLTVGLITLLAGSVLHGELRRVSIAISYGTLYSWAWLELFQGINYARRAMGLAVMIALVLWVDRSGLVL